jgi:hypothetical protein
VLVPFIRPQPKKVTQDPRVEMVQQAVTQASQLWMGVLAKWSLQSKGRRDMA